MIRRQTYLLKYVRHIHRCTAKTCCNPNDLGRHGIQNLGSFHLDIVSDEAHVPSLCDNHYHDNSLFLQQQIKYTIWKLRTAFRCRCCRCWLLCGWWLCCCTPAHNNIGLITPTQHRVKQETIRTLNQRIMSNRKPFGWRIRKLGQAGSHLKTETGNQDKQETSRTLKKRTWSSWKSSGHWKREPSQTEKRQETKTE